MFLRGYWLKKAKEIGDSMFNYGKTDINAGVKECSGTPRAVLVDVREPHEFNAGHIPGAINIPLSTIDQISIEKDIPVFVYCLRGSRSKRAAEAMKKMGYADVKSIGGIKQYTGKLEK